MSLRPQTRLDATGWRDEALSKRRRLWGFDVPCVDADFLLVEYDRLEPVALIEFKHGGPQQLPDAELVALPGVRVLSRLAERSRLPAFLVVYSRAPWTFRVLALNGAAGSVAGEPATLGELGFVELLYRLRRREVPPAVLANVGVDGVSTRELLSGGGR